MELSSRKHTTKEMSYFLITFYLIKKNYIKNTTCILKTSDLNCIKER